MDKNNLGIIKDMAKLFSATILSGLFFTGCVDMDLTPKNQPSEGEVWADATMAEQTVTGLYNGLNHLYNDNYNMWFDCFSAVMDRDANWRNFGMLFGNQTTSGDGPSWIWHDNYKFIIRCNDVIANMPDVVGLPGIHIEVKRRENLNVYEAIEQAKRDAAKIGTMPTVMWRKNDHEWLVTMPMEAWMQLYQKAGL